jgi:hypothetical protein
MMNAENASEKRWWGSFPIRENEERYWRIGPLSLWISRSESEWRIVHERSEDPLDSRLVVCASDAPASPSDGSDLNRYGFRRTSESVQLAAALADRPLVVSTEVPFYLPPSEQTTLFISAPLWIKILVANPGKELQELPLYRPSDTWFGPSTLEGELAYAARTSARLNLDALPVRPQRAICAVRVINGGGSQLRLAKLKLPMPQLSLFETSDHRLWTEQVTLEREGDGEMASIRFGAAAPSSARGAKRIFAPRSKGVLIRAFGAIF